MSILSVDTQNLLRSVMKGLGGTDVIELGAWLGESARLLVDCGARRVYSVDTWLGSPELLAMPEPQNAHASFLAATSGLPIEALRLDSISGLTVLAKRGISPSLIFIDAGHEWEHAFGDTHAACRLFPKAQIVLDDCGHPPVADGARAAAQMCGRSFIMGVWPALIPV